MTNEPGGGASTMPASTARTIYFHPQVAFALLLGTATSIFRYSCSIFARLSRAETVTLHECLFPARFHPSVSLFRCLQPVMFDPVVAERDG